MKIHITLIRVEIDGPVFRFECQVCKSDAHAMPKYFYDVLQRFTEHECKEDVLLLDLGIVDVESK